MSSADDFIRTMAARDPQELEQQRAEAWGQTAPDGPADTIRSAGTALRAAAAQGCHWALNPVAVQALGRLLAIEADLIDGRTAGGDPDAIDGGGEHLLDLAVQILGATT